MKRRTFLECLGLELLGAGIQPGLAAAREADAMWGMIAKITTVPGERDKFMGVLRESAAGMPGCFSYVVAKDAADENVVWVTEVWASQVSHDRSLSLPAVKNAIPKGKSLVANFETVAVTAPVWGEGLPTKGR
jgi:quinol monooxygenase YgiN